MSDSLPVSFSDAREFIENGDLSVESRIEDSKELARFLRAVLDAAHLRDTCLVIQASVAAVSENVMGYHR